RPFPPTRDRRTRCPSASGTRRSRSVGRLAARSSQAALPFVEGKALPLPQTVDRLLEQGARSEKPLLQAVVEVRGTRVELERDVAELAQLGDERGEDPLRPHFALGARGGGKRLLVGLQELVRLDESVLGRQNEPAVARPLDVAASPSEQ